MSISVEEFTSHSIRNAEAIKKAGRCSCYFCMRTFNASEVEDWIVEICGETAICPHCTVDALLPGEIDQTLLAAGCERWFTGVVTQSEKA